MLSSDAVVLRSRFVVVSLTRLDAFCLGRDMLSGAARVEFRQVEARLAALTLKFDNEIATKRVGVRCLRPDGCLLSFAVLRSGATVQMTPAERGRHVLDTLRFTNRMLAPSGGGDAILSAADHAAVSVGSVNEADLIGRLLPHLQRVLSSEVFDTQRTQWLMHSEDMGAHGGARLRLRSWDR